MRAIVGNYKILALGLYCFHSQNIELTVMSIERKRMRLEKRNGYNVIYLSSMESTKNLQSKGLESQLSRECTPLAPALDSCSEQERAPEPKILLSGLWGALHSRPHSRCSRPHSWCSRPRSCRSRPCSLPFPITLPNNSKISPSYLSFFSLALFGWVLKVF